MKKITNPLEMPLRVDLFGNGIVYELWSWIDHIGETTRHGHYIAVTRESTSQWPPEFCVFDDGKDSTIVFYEGDKPVSKQAALVIYVREDVVKRVCGTPTVTAIQFQDHIQKTYLFVRKSMVLVTCLMRSKKY